LSRGHRQQERKDKRKVYVTKKPDGISQWGGKPVLKFAGGKGGAGLGEILGKEDRSLLFRGRRKMLSERKEAELGRNFLGNEFFHQVKEIR